MTNVVSVRNRLRALRITRILRQGGCIAHATATLPGIAANPNSKPGVRQLQRFKQRQGPFLLLADSIETALRQARYISPVLRKTARSCWPGPVTLIIPAKPGLHSACYKNASLAIRVDASETTRVLAKACGGLLLSSSLNRKKKKTYKPDRKTELRFSTFLSARLNCDQSSGKASKIMRVWRNHCTVLRA
ncbi:MAG: Sua5/YciO/YrdC/YwlC family protein [Mariprofundus sp.]|nr:Sua5/YciO/YrdC/YwlC family protein [Mariprofundus sp.]